MSGVIHPLTDQRNPGPCIAAARSQGGLLETQPRWHATICMVVVTLSCLDPLALLGILTPVPRAIFGRGGSIYIFRAKFTWAIFNIDAKITLLKFSLSYLP